ncbi:unnamed protein product, partial [Closterium sp. NIES-53]
SPSAPSPQGTWQQQRVCAASGEQQPSASLCGTATPSRSGPPSPALLWLVGSPIPAVSTSST